MPLQRGVSSFDAHRDARFVARMSRDGYSVSGARASTQLQWSAQRAMPVAAPLN
jgi:alpha-beta hydrolase superfamily lysophospholipase